jgi:hypothetical protein
MDHGEVTRSEVEEVACSQLIRLLRLESPAHYWLTFGEVVALASGGLTRVLLVTSPVPTGRELGNQPAPRCQQHDRPDRAV